MVTWNTRWLVGGVVNVGIAFLFLHHGYQGFALFAAFAAGVAVAEWNYTKNKKEDSP